MRVTLVSQQNTLFVLENESVSLPPVPGRYLSLLALSPVCRGITLRQVKYTLTDAQLIQEVPLGVSNEFLPGLPAEIEVKDGTLLVCLSADSPSGEK